MAIATVTIEERQTGGIDMPRWRVRWIGEEPQDFETGAEALAAVKRRDLQAVEAGAAMAITLIEWEPRTRLGLAVVRALGATFKEVGTVKQGRR